MTPYITLNGISSADMGLRLVEAEPFILPRRTRQRETIPGRLGSIASSDFEMPPVGYRLRLAASGEDKATVVRALHQIASWALSGRLLTVWHEPNHYYTGAVEGDADFTMLTKRTGQLALEFLCDPPCRHKALTPAPWFPSQSLPIPEQLSDTVRTAMLSGQTAAFTLAAGVVSGSLSPALYLRLTGYWSTLTIGGTLNITEGSGSTTLYIDCEAQQVYKMVGGIRTPVKYAGDFPTLSGGNLAIDGTGFNLTARLLVIERG